MSQASPAAPATSSASSSRNAPNYWSPLTLFSTVEIDPAVYAQRLEAPVARKSYAIYFTPRARSSWLTELVAGTGRLGRPGELFNPVHVPAIAKALKAGDIEQYIEMIKRFRAPGGVFGFEITWPQVLSTFGGVDRYLAHFSAVPSLWLIREDIVAQAVSLTKMVQTRIAHAAGNSPEAIAAADREFRYDPTEIRRRINQIFAIESQTEAFFEQNGINPIRISYERLGSLNPVDVLNLIADAVHEPRFDTYNDEANEHRKIGTDKNLAFAECYIADNRSFIANINKRRRVLQHLNPKWLTWARLEKWLR